jgi:hypothetical protein
MLPTWVTSRRVATTGHNADLFDRLVSPQQKCACESGFAFTGIVEGPGAQNDNHAGGGLCPICKGYASRAKQMRIYDLFDEILDTARDSSGDWVVQRGPDGKICRERRL